ncbi:hypothetical protein KUCAC02_005731, partial [Chaenocephalus aceratus]
RESGHNRLLPLGSGTSTQKVTCVHVTVRKQEGRESFVLHADVTSPCYLCIVTGQTGTGNGPNLWFVAAANEQIAGALCSPRRHPSAGRDITRQQQ